MRIVIFGSVLALLSLTNAQAQVGSNAYGGACFGAYCDPRPPMTGGGTNAFGGYCLGPYCEQSREREPSPYQPYATVAPEPYSPTYSRPATNRFSNGFDNEPDR
jgi:hypothetical protein